MPAGRVATSVGAAEPASRAFHRLTREQVVDRIISLNSSASPEFLSMFDQPDLTEYLHRLDGLSEPRGRRAVWSRSGRSPAILTRRRTR